jgi:hypothetical protein
MKDFVHACVGTIMNPAIMNKAHNLNIAASDFISFSPFWFQPILQFPDRSPLSSEHLQ